MSDLRQDITAIPFTRVTISRGESVGIIIFVSSPFSVYIVLVRLSLYMITGRHSSRINHCNILVRSRSPSVGEFIPPASQGAIPKESKSTSPHYAPVRTASILKLSPESRTPSSSPQSSVIVDNQRGTLLELKVISAHRLAPLFQNYPPGLRPGLHEPTGLVRLS